jgi:DNA-binding FrmR family transcriptional regulator
MLLKLSVPVNGGKTIDSRWQSDMISISPPRGEGEKKMKNEKALVRLRTIEGHLKGINRMVENGDYCIDVIRQIQAVQSALDKVSSMILDEHLKTCVITAVRGEDVSERERVLAEIGEIFEHSNKA